MIKTVLHHEQIDDHIEIAHVILEADENIVGSIESERVNISVDEIVILEGRIESYHDIGTKLAMVILEPRQQFSVEQYQELFKKSAALMCVQTHQIMPAVSPIFKPSWDYEMWLQECGKSGNKMQSALDLI